MSDRQLNRLCQFLPPLSQQPQHYPHVLLARSSGLQHGQLDYEVRLTSRCVRPPLIDSFGHDSWFQLGNWFLTFYIITNLVGESVRNPRNSCWAGTPFDVEEGGFFSDHDFLGIRTFVSEAAAYNMLTSFCSQVCPLPGVCDDQY